MKYNRELLNRFVNGKVMVAVRTSTEWDKFMQLLIKETDVTWGGGQQPTEFNDWLLHEELTVISCGKFEESKLMYEWVDNHEACEHKIIEFKELIDGGNEMVNTGQNYRGLFEKNYRELFVKTKIENFVKSQWNFEERYKTYKGYVSVAGYQLEEYLDFLEEMKSFGIGRDEIEQIIIKDYLTEKESENDE